MAVVLKTIGFGYFDGRPMAALAGRELELTAASGHLSSVFAAAGQHPAIAVRD